MNYGGCPADAEMEGALGGHYTEVPGPTLRVLPGYSLELTLEVVDRAGRAASDNVTERGI